MQIVFQDAESAAPVGQKSSVMETEEQKLRRQKRSKQLQAGRRALPIFTGRDQILQAVQQNQVTLLVGETGSGKTTQIPQYLYEAGYGRRGVIGCTQPRRVAATSLARRVSEEMGVRLGHNVGYAIRFDDCTSPITKVKYMTDGMLLRESLSDPDMKRYSVIILDEAHERTLRTDILFGMVKRILPRRPDLKVIVMSATLDVEKFSSFFPGSEVLYVEGRQHPVRLMCTLQPQSDYLDAALVTIFQIHLEQPAGDVLVFLSGQEDIESLYKLIREHAPQCPPEALTIAPCMLFAHLPTHQQSAVFKPAAEGTRKVILATNIAETSITVPGVRYVVDSGVCKSRHFNPRTGIESLMVQPISKAAARQRSGRAGREAPGICYRLYTNDSFTQLSDNEIPEIKRCDLANVILMLKASGVDNVMEFDYLDIPTRDSLKQALEQLFALGALDHSSTLTPLGRQMASFPLDPMLSKILIRAQEFGCVAEAVDMIALLSVDTIFFTPHEQQEEAAEAKRKFLSSDGDHITMLNVLRAFLTTGKDKKWCMDNFILYRSMAEVLEHRKHLQDHCRQQKFEPSSCGSDYDKLLQCLLTGLFQRIAIRQPDRSYMTLVTRQQVYIHPASTCPRDAEVVMYQDVMRTSKQWMRTVSRVMPQWLSSSAPAYLSTGR